MRSKCQKILDNFIDFSKWRMINSEWELKIEKLMFSKIKKKFHHPALNHAGSPFDSIVFFKVFNVVFDFSKVPDLCRSIMFFVIFSNLFFTNSYAGVRKELKVSANENEGTTFKKHPSNIEYVPNY